MRILQVTQSFKPAWETGGPCRAVYEISRTLVDRGHNVTVLTTDRGKPRVKAPRNVPWDVDGIRTYYMSNISNYLAAHNMTFPCLLPLVARREVEHFDVIHIHEHRTVLAATVAYYAKKSGIPYVVQCHGSALPSNEKQAAKRMFDWICGNRLLKRASRVIALTKTEASQLDRIGVARDKVRIVPTGINLSEYDDSLKKGMFRDKHGIHANEKIVLYLGRIHKNKGIDILIEAFSQIEESLNARLMIVGPDDGHRKHLESMIERLGLDGKVSFVGYVSNETRLSAFADSDVFVTPSFSGFPATFLEACASGLPVVMTNKGDELDWVHERVGYVVDYDSNELRKAIEKLLKNEYLRRTYGEAARNLMKEEFAWDRIVSKMEETYREAIGERRTP
jgi:glycosyltransferase involved in cell wall biosynthesis